MDDRIDREYYTSRRSELLQAFDQDVGCWRSTLARRHGDEFANAIVRQSRDEFEALIGEIPYIGGDENHLTENLVESARCLALYRAMKARGKRVEETGRALYEAIEQSNSRPTPPIPPGKRLSPEGLMRRRRERARRSQERRYPEDWVYEFVEGDGRTFDYGNDFTECAVQKFYRGKRADEFLPFFCFLDFPRSKAAGLGLTRTQTLAEGHEKCNHRFKAGRAAEEEWPPRFLRREQET